MFGLEKTLRSLTRSPFDSILAAAHRMARPLHFEEGGTVKAQAGAESQHSDNGFILPSDVREEEVVNAIRDWLQAKRYSNPGRNSDAVSSLKTTAGGRVFVPADVVLLLGDGTVDRGKRVLEKVVNEIRHRRVLSRLPPTPVMPNRR
jgi:hypothetical protein